MTYDNNDEEKLLIDQLLYARHAIELHKKEDAARKTIKAKLEKQLQEIEQAMIDYFDGNGLLNFETETHKVTRGYSTSIEVPDVDALPEEFIRTKITKEPNKILIGELKPDANWYSVKQSDKITITHKGA